MKTKRFILVGVLMSLLKLSIYAEVRITYEDNTLIATTDQEGISGWHGCSQKSAVKAPGYVFKLQIEKRGNNSCETGLHKGWRTVATKSTDLPQVVFNDLEDRNYRVLCKVGKAIGCLIANAPSQWPPQSIIYEIEKSKSVRQISHIISKGSNGKDDHRLMLFPNPSDDLVNLSLTNHSLNGPVVLIVLDVLGRTVIQQDLVDFTSRRFNYQLNLRDQPSGTYLIELKDQFGVRYVGKAIHYKK